MKRLWKTCSNLRLLLQRELDHLTRARAPNSQRRLFAVLGRALGHFMFSLIGLKRVLFTNIFQKL